MIRACRRREDPCSHEDLGPSDILGLTLPLESCASCSGFVRFDAEKCHHCGAILRATPAPGRPLLTRLGKGILGIAGGASLATTLMACYGLAPQYRQPPEQVRRR